MLSEFNKELNAKVYYKLDELTKNTELSDISAGDSIVVNSETLNRKQNIKSKSKILNLYKNSEYKNKLLELIKYLIGDVVKSPVEDLLKDILIQDKKENVKDTDIISKLLNLVFDYDQATGQVINISVADAHNKRKIKNLVSQLNSNFRFEELISRFRNAGRVLEIRNSAYLQTNLLSRAFPSKNKYDFLKLCYTPKSMLERFSDSSALMFNNNSVEIMILDNILSDIPQEFLNDVLVFISNTLAKDSILIIREYNINPYISYNTDLLDVLNLFANSLSASVSKDEKHIIPVKNYNPMKHWVSLLEQKNIVPFDELIINKDLLNISDFENGFDGNIMIFRKTVESENTKNHECNEHLK